MYYVIKFQQLQIFEENFGIYEILRSLSLLKIK